MLLAVVQAAYVQGDYPRNVDDLERALGPISFDKSRVSRIYSELDEFVEDFRSQPPHANHPYLQMDAPYLKVRQVHRIVRQALMVAIAVRDTTDRRTPSTELDRSDEYALCQGSLRGQARIHSTNPPEHLNNQVRRRTNMVAVSVDEHSPIRLFGGEPLEDWVNCRPAAGTSTNSQCEDCRRRNRSWQASPAR